MKGIDSTAAPLVHVPGWVGGWVGGCKSRFKHCLQQSKNERIKNYLNGIMIAAKCLK
jgi:hypothetical protein